jgi:hypothetical protein
MPFNMIAKCARAKALKMAFSDELSGLHIEEEAAAFNDTTISAAAIDPAKGVDVDDLKARIEACADLETLGALYRANRVYKAFAELFTERANVLKAAANE